MTAVLVEKRNEEIGVVVALIQMYGLNPDMGVL